MPSILARPPGVLVAVAVLAGCVTFAAVPARASLEIQLQSAGQTWNDSGSSPLIVAQSIGNFAFSGDIGTAGPGAALNLTSLNISDLRGGTLTITLSENNLSGPIGLTSFLTQFSGAALFGNVTMSMQTYIDDGNTLLGTGTALASLGSSRSAFSLSSSDSAVTTDPYALTEVITISGRNFQIDALNGSVTAQESTPVPEPASLALLGSGLFGLGLIRRRRRPG